MPQFADPADSPVATRDSRRDLRTQDYATPDTKPATVSSGTDDDTDPLPNRRFTSILFWRMVKALDPDKYAGCARRCRWHGCKLACDSRS